MTDRVMEHGRSLAGLEPSSYRATLEFNLAGGYPIGVFLPFGAAQKLVGGRPRLGLPALHRPSSRAMLSLSLWEILGGPPCGAPACGPWPPSSPPSRRCCSATRSGAGSRRSPPRASSLSPPPWRRPPCGRDGPPRDAVAAGDRRRRPGRSAQPRRHSSGSARCCWRSPCSPGGASARAPAAIRAARLRPPARRARHSRVSAGLVPPTSNRRSPTPTREGNLRPPSQRAAGARHLARRRLPLRPQRRPSPPRSSIALGLVAAAGRPLAAARRRAERPLLYRQRLLSPAPRSSSSAHPGRAAKRSPPPRRLPSRWRSSAPSRRCAWTASPAACCCRSVAGGVLWSNVLAYGGVSLAPYEQLARAAADRRALRRPGPGA